MAVDSDAAQQLLIQSLEARIAEKKQENIDLRKQMFEIQRKSAENEQNYESRIRELTANVDRLKGLNERLIKLNVEIKEEYSKQPQAEFKELYWKLLVVHEESEKKRHECEARILSLTKKYDEAVEKLNEERELHDSKRADEGDEKVAAMMKAIDEMRMNNESLQESNLRLMQKVEKVKERKREFAKLQEEVSNLREENQTLRSELSASKMSVDVCELESLRKSVEESDLRETAITLELEKMEKRCAQLEKDKAKLEADLKIVSRTSPDVSNLCSEISSLKKEITVKEDTLTGLTMQLKIIREENARLKKRMQTNRIETREKLESASHNKALEQKCERLLQENDKAMSEIRKLEADLKDWQLKANTNEQELEQQKRKFTSQIDMITRDNEEAKHVNDEAESNREKVLKQAQKISLLKEELNEARYVIHQLLAKEDDEDGLKTALEYLDVIKTLEEKLTDSEMIHKKSLEERDEYRKKNAQLGREIKQLRATMRKREEVATSQLQVSDLQKMVETLGKRVEEHETFKGKMLQKMRTIKDENAELKRQLSKSKSDIANYQFQLVEMREQLITSS